MSARQLIVLAVAFIAAIGALLLIRGIGSQAEAPAAEIAPVSGVHVLIATRPIAQGAALTASDIGWAAFPDDTVTTNFVTQSRSPDALTEYSGAVTRRTFVAGEPITTGSVIQPEGRGFMAAQLPPGYRAVSVEIDREDAAGGYIQPNDRVDVILTSRGDRSESVARSEVVLADVRVLALGDQTQPPPAGEGGPTPIIASIAVLELSADDARTLALADQLGSISLALRGVETEAAGLRAPSARRNARALDQQGEAVRIHAFGSVREGGGR